jgi:U3 small nucleolar RNA-associated protein 5
VKFPVLAPSYRAACEIFPPPRDHPAALLLPPRTMATAVSHRRRDDDDHHHHAAPPAKRAKTSGSSSSGSRSKDKTTSRLERAVANGSARKLAADQVKPAQNTKAHQVDENEATISKRDGHGDIPVPGTKKIAAAAVEISSDSSSSDDDSDAEPEKPAATANGTTNGIMVEDDAMELDEEAQPEEEQTFGELIAQSEPIDVEAAFDNSHSDLSRQPNNRLQPPSATSLSTVLSQALRTNDTELIESCFDVNDLDSVRTTIERLDSPLVASLLKKLAEKMHRRPGRAGSLMVWVQWTLVSHGGYLAGQPDVLAQIGSLNRVIKERATGLQPLLTLKGKLDMLSAQLEFRRSVQARARFDEDDDEAVIYVEGEEDEEEAPQDKGNAESEEEDDGTYINGIIIDAQLGAHRPVPGSEEGSSDEEEDELEVKDGVSEGSVESDSDSDSSEDDDESEPESAAGEPSPPPPPTKGKNKKR